MTDSARVSVREFEPKVLIFDPANSLGFRTTRADASAMLTRLIDFLKMQGITAMLTTMTSAEPGLEDSDADISSLVDTWLLLRDIELSGERNRALYVLKSRGMAHSNQLREFKLTDHGIELTDVYLGAEGVLTGSARVAQEAREEASAVRRQQEVEGKQRELERKREALEARITALRKEFEAEAEEAGRVIGEEKSREEITRQDRQRMGTSRRAGAGASSGDRPARPRKVQEVGK